MRAPSMSSTAAPRPTHASTPSSCPIEAAATASSLPPSARLPSARTARSRSTHSNMAISCGDGGGRVRQLVLEALIEADALLPGERMGMVRVVGRDEAQDGGARRGEIGQLAAGQTLLAQDGEPRFDKGEPGGVERQPV